MAKKRLSKKVAKLEKKAEGLRKQADKKGHELQARAAERIDGLREDKKPKRRKGVLAMLIAAAAAVGIVLKRKRDQELDEALWEEPKSL
jgi:hypothetical protein